MALSSVKQIVRFSRPAVIPQHIFYSQDMNNRPGVPAKNLGRKYALPVGKRDEPVNLYTVFSRGGETLTDFRLLLTSMDFSLDGVKKFWKMRKEEKHLWGQAFLPERLEYLGPDLAAAHFTVFRDGKVKFRGQEDWITKGDDDYELGLPKHYDAGYVLEHVDLSGTGILYEGLENLKLLENLKTLKLASCSYIDDWCLDRISGEYKESLEFLDISGCPLVTERGLSSLSRLRKLKHLHISKFPRAVSQELVCLLLEEAIPGLQITGFHYYDESLLENLQTHRLDDVNK